MTTSILSLVIDTVGKGLSYDIPEHQHTSSNNDVTKVPHKSTTLVSGSPVQIFLLQLPLLGLLMGAILYHQQERYNKSVVCKELGYMPSTNCENRKCQLATMFIGKKMWLWIGIVCGLGLFPVVAILMTIGAIVLFILGLLCSCCSNKSNAS
ncbi:hypothetical protein C10C_0031 [Chlamydia serpentis]|uniref:Uncharacterized protein n=1 Tax=Chlamydia serpentis TaxID=1967782 RepID=A0A2R8FA74_9CHLA|nr:hypothetical protein [Chlamydia serpentis]SPN73222.1 hypothetical protein C10C_0031 [Chlamydia serpentis]